MRLCDGPCSQHAGHTDPWIVNKMQLLFYLPLVVIFPTPDENSDSSHGFCSHLLPDNTISYNLYKSKTVSLTYVKCPLKKF